MKAAFSYLSHEEQTRSSMNNKATLCSRSSVDQLVQQLSFWNLFKKQIKVDIGQKFRFPDLGPGSNGCKSIGDRFR